MEFNEIAQTDQNYDENQIDKSYKSHTNSYK